MASRFLTRKQELVRLKRITSALADLLYTSPSQALRDYASDALYKTQHEHDALEALIANTTKAGGR